MSEDIEVRQIGFIKGFKLVPYDQNLYNNILGYYNNKQVELTIRERRKKISTNTHGYYRGVLIPTVLSTEAFGGWDRHKVHKFFAHMFLKDIETIEVRGKIYIIETILSTAKLSQKEMNLFIDKVREYLLIEHQITILDPVKN